MKKLPPPETIDLERSDLREVLDFRPDQGIIRLHEQRVVILSAAAMGLLRKELIDTLGLETARRLMLRFGYADGYHDAVSLRDRSKWANPLEGLRAGAVLHRLEGIVRTDITKVEHDATSGRFEENVVWHRSYVAEQHVHHYGKSNVPVCWSLEGYASGYVSACLGQEIYFRETECLAQGAQTCSVVGRDAESWGDALDALRFDFQGANLGHEVERLREAVHKRLQELDRRERHVAKRELELNLLRERVASHAAAKHFIAGSASMQDVLELAARVAPLDTTVLVYGESGTGKEFIVRLIHDQSPRAERSVCVHQLRGPDRNTAGIRTLRARAGRVHGCRARQGRIVRSGGERHALPGRNRRSRADGAGEAPACATGARDPASRRGTHLKVNARVVAATNRDLRAAVDAGTFREDLYFRLGAFVITVPPLRERREDIPSLVHDFLGRAAMRVKKDVKTVSAEAMTALMNYSWPGNVRELEHAIERAVIVARGTSVKVRELPPEVSQKTRARSTDDSLDLHTQERAMIERALERFRGNRRQAADALKISPVTLWRKMKQYGLGT